MRLQVTQEFYPPCIGSAKVLTFFFVFTAILVPKKKRKRKCGCIFRSKKKTPKNKKMRFLAPKIKKRNSVGL